MNENFERLMHGWFDATLTADEFEALSAGLKTDPRLAAEFARLAFLHDQLHHTLNRGEVSQPQPAPQLRRSRSLVSLALGAVSAAVLALFVLWQVTATRSAAAHEIQRIIAAEARELDRTYLISLEESAEPDARPHSLEKGRPPKPSIDGARLYVRGPNQFVLERTMEGEQRFITGSNGRESWAVRPDGPVRASPDLTRFHRDVPGHEHAMPLSRLQDGLTRLEAAYDVQVMPRELNDDRAAEIEPSRLLIAVKKPGFRGPKRVEITYAATSGEIRQMRFVDMPYGPERITIRVTLLSVEPLNSAFFDHESHHEPTRTVEVEE